MKHRQKSRHNSEPALWASQAMLGYIKRRPSIASLGTKLKKLPSLKRVEGQVDARMIPGVSRLHCPGSCSTICSQASLLLATPQTSTPARFIRLDLVNGTRSLVFDVTIEDKASFTMQRDRIKTLYLDANGSGPQVIKADTILRGVFGYTDGAAPPAWVRRFPSVMELFAHLRQFYGYLSYVLDWRDAFCQEPELDVEVCNINNLTHYGRCLLTIRKYDLVVVSPAAAGDDMTVLLKTTRWLERRRGKLAILIGNEYELMDEKIDFIRTVGADIICSQLSSAAAHYLYAECEQSRFITLPPALNPAVYYPMPTIQRNIDIGFIGDIYWPFIGDKERTDLIRFFEAHGASFGLHCDIRTERIPRPEWAKFLNACHSIIGAESGTYYLNDRCRLLTAARNYNLNENRQATFEEVFERFYQGQPRVASGKTISARHFEPIGTKTCQILLEGDYQGMLKADEHYISVKKDLSNIDEAIRQFKDADYRQAIVERAYEHVMQQHTYHHRVQTLLQALA